MTFEPNLADATGVASGVLLVALGAAVGLVRPRRRTNLLLAAFCASFGLTYVLVNVALAYEGGAAPAPLVLGTSLAEYASALLLVLLALRLPTKSMAVSAIAAAAAVGIGFVALATWAVPYPVLSANPVARGSLWPFVGAVLFFLTLLVTRVPKLPEQEQRQAALMTVAIALLPAVNAGATLFAIPHERVAQVLGMGILGAVAAAWLVRASQGVVPRASRNVALAILGAILAGLVAQAAALTEAVHMNALARIAGVALLAYAILRHQLLGIDVKVRWGISRTTVAAVFIAVFFVASEATQEFFGETLGSNYVGILAAGLLVFAIAPLSRFADRVAERAVPVASPDAGGAQETTFRDAVRYTLRDGGVSRKEELHLARLAEALGVGAARATEIRHEIEEEAQPS